MPSRAELMNRALRVFSGNRVVDPQENTPEAVHLNGAWDGARDAVLADFPFSFAVKWATLAEVQAPPFGFARAYRLPEDCLYVVDVRGQGDLRQDPPPHMIVGRDVYTDAAPCLTRYVHTHTDVAFWPPHFCAAFCMRLAAEVAPYLTQSASSGLELLQTYETLLSKAAAQDMRQENPPDVEWQATAHMARRR